MSYGDTFISDPRASGNASILKVDDPDFMASQRQLGEGKAVQAEITDTAKAEVELSFADAINRAKEIIEKKLSVRETENQTSKFKKQKKQTTFKDPNILDLEKELSNKIGLKTSIHFNEDGSSGSLTLYYSDLNQLDEIMKRLKK